MTCAAPLDYCQIYGELKRAELDLALGKSVSSVAFGSERTNFRAVDKVRLNELIAEYGALCGNPAIVPELRGGNRVPAMGVCFSDNLCGSCRVRPCGCGC